MTIVIPGLSRTCCSLPCRVGAGGHLRGGLRIGALVSDDKRGRRGSFLTAAHFMGRPAIRWAHRRGRRGDVWSWKGHEESKQDCRREEQRKEEKRSFPPLTRGGSGGAGDEGGGGGGLSRLRVWELGLAYTSLRFSSRAIASLRPTLNNPPPLLPPPPWPCEAELLWYKLNSRPKRSFFTGPIYKNGPSLLHIGQWIAWYTNK